MYQPTRQSVIWVINRRPNCRVQLGHRGTSWTSCAIFKGTKVWSLLMLVRDSHALMPLRWTSMEIFRNIPGWFPKWQYLRRLAPTSYSGFLHRKSLLFQCAIQKGFPASSIFILLSNHIWFWQTDLPSCARSSLRFHKRKLSQFRISRIKRHGRVQLPLGGCLMFVDVIGFLPMQALPRNLGQSLFLTSVLAQFLSISTGAFNLICLEGHGYF